MLIKVAYVAYVKDHKDSKGDAAPWTIRDHKDDHIISSHATEEAAKAHLQQMHAHSSSAKRAGVHEDAVAVADKAVQMALQVCDHAGAIHSEFSDWAKRWLAGSHDEKDANWASAEMYDFIGTIGSLRGTMAFSHGEVYDPRTVEDKTDPSQNKIWNAAHCAWYAAQCARAAAMLLGWEEKKNKAKEEKDRSAWEKAKSEMAKLERLVFVGYKNTEVYCYQAIKGLPGGARGLSIFYGKEQAAYKVAGAWMVIDPECPGARRLSMASVYDQHIDGCPRCQAYNRQFVTAALKKGYGVHPADCTCGWCEHKGNIAKDEKEEEKKEAAAKRADTADNPASEEGGEGTIHPKTDAEKPKTAGLSHGEFYAPDVHEVVGEWLGLGRKHALRKTSDIQMTCPWCKAGGRQPGIAHKQHPEDEFHCPQCGWSSGSKAASQEGPIRKTAAAEQAGYHDVTKAEDSLRALEGFFSGYSETDPKDDIKHAFDALEGSESPALEDIRTELERAYNMDDFSEAADAVDRIQLELETFVETGGHGNLPQEEVAEEIAAPLPGSMGVAASERSREAARRKEAWLRRNRQSSVREFGDIFAEAMARFRTAAPVQPEVAQAKAESEAPPAKVPETTDPCALADQKGGEDAGGVPRLATEHGDINISISLDGGTSKVKSKLPPGDGPKEKKDDKKEKKDKKADDRRIGCGCSLCKTAHPACTGYRHEAGPCNCEKVRAAQPAPKKAEGIQRDLSGAKEKLEHGAKECLSNSPESVQTKDPIELAKQADQSVSPDIEEAKRGVGGKSKAELAGSPEATQTTDPLDLGKQADEKKEVYDPCAKCGHGYWKHEGPAGCQYPGCGCIYHQSKKKNETEDKGKQACAPAGDDLDEAVDMEIGLGDLANLGANLPPVAWGEKETPQVGEGGLNSEPKEKKAAAFRATGDATEGLLGLDPGGDRR